MHRVCWIWFAVALSAGPTLTRAADEVRLLNGRDLSGWKAYLEDPKAKAEDAWSVANKVLVCKGTPKGYLYTENDHADFVLKFQWRWPEGKPAGNGGVLLRMTGKHKIWPKSLEAQINAGSAGDFWGLDDFRLAGDPARSSSLSDAKFGKLTNLKKLKANEKPAGQWNDYEIIAKGGKVTLRINGELLNETVRCEEAAGKICLTSEGDAIEFRNITLKTLKTE
jgi:hypothetical protein